MRRLGVPRIASRVALLCLATTLVVTGCTAGPSSRPAIIGGNAPAPVSALSSSAPRSHVAPLDPSNGAGLSWQDCPRPVLANLNEAHVQLPGNLTPRCSRLSTKLGEGTVPSLMNIQLGLLKVGSGPIPLLVLNDVDGVPGSVYAAQLATKLPKPLLSKFTLIGMDRRGTGDSDAINCIPRRDRAALAGPDPASNDTSGLLDADRAAVQNCQTTMENRLTSYNTHNTVKDLELVRQRLGVAHLNAIGRGEGSRVLGAYASRYPGHVGRMVFDGYPDPSAEIQDRFQQRADSAEQAFDAFARDCAQRSCPLGARPRQTVMGLLDRLRGKPLPAQGYSIGPGLVVQAILIGLADRDRWNELASALAAAGNGNAKPLAAFLAPQLIGDPTGGSRLDAGLVTTCNDEDSRLPPKQVNTAVRQWRGQDPLFGAVFGQRLLRCQPWPQPARSVGKPKGAHLPTLLVVSTANDPVTPGDGTERVAQQLPSAVRISWQGSGHGAVGVSDCATTKVTAYLARGQSPSSSTVCPA